MRKWLPLTYAPKVNAVRSGLCNQTIRPDWRFKPGDWVGFHTWGGKPYHAPWGERFGPYLISCVLDLMVEPAGVWFMPTEGEEEPGMVPWMHPKVCGLAIRDHIQCHEGQNPGEALHDVLASFYGVDFKALGKFGKMQAIIWVVE